MNKEEILDSIIKYAEEDSNAGGEVDLNALCDYIKHLKEKETEEGNDLIIEKLDYMISSLDYLVNKL